MGEEAVSVKPEGQGAQDNTDSGPNQGGGGGGGPQGGNPGGNQTGPNQGGGGGGPGGNQGMGNQGMGNQGGQGGGNQNRGGPGGGGRGGNRGGGQGGGGRGDRKGGSRFSGGRGGGPGGGGPGGNQGGRMGPGGNQGGGNMGGGILGMGGGNMNMSMGMGMNEMQIKMSESMMENMMDESMIGGGGGLGGPGGPGGPGGRGPGQQMNRGQRGGRSGGGGGGGGGQRGNQGGGGGMQGRSQDDRLMERVMQISGPTHELPPTSVEGEKKFSGRNRLYVGNLTNDITEEEIQQMFGQYGETNELFINKEKNFAFLRLDFHANAEKAKRELDGSVRKGRVLKVRFAPNSSMVKVKNLTPWVSNELLAHAFSVFGELERATVIVDERGKSTGEGIVEFTRKPSAQMALRKCTEGCYFLTTSLRPVVVEMYEPSDEIDGYPDKNLPKKNPEFFKSRENGPRFAAIGSFEHEYGTRWKQLHELYKQKEEALKREMAMEEEKLDAQMEFARFEHETEMLREQLRIREADRERQKREWENRERKAEEQRTREEELRRRQEEEMALRIRRQEEELHRRQQENNLFQQEQAMRCATGAKNFDGIPPERDGYPPVDGNNLPVDPKSFMDQYSNMDRNNRGGYNDERGQIMDLMDMRVDMGNMGNMGNNRGVPAGAGGAGGGGAGGGGGGGGGRWQGGGNDRQRPDEFPNKRRRY